MFTKYNPGEDSDQTTGGQVCSVHCVISHLQVRELGYDTAICDTMNET